MLEIPLRQGIPPLTFTFLLANKDVISIVCALTALGQLWSGQKMRFVKGNAGLDRG